MHLPGRQGRSGNFELVNYRRPGLMAYALMHECPNALHCGGGGASAGAPSYKLQGDEGYER